MADAFQRDGTERLRFDILFDARQRLLVDQYLSAFSLAAQPRSSVRDAADACVFPALIEADGAEGRIALGNAYAQGEVECALSP